MVDDRIIHEWLAKAHEDFEFARVNLQEGKPFFAQICFHFHQAAEKYLKSYIVAHELDFRKVHDLPLLLKICASDNPSGATLREACEYLTAFYVDTRYPVHWPTHFSPSETQRSFQSCAKIKAWVESQLDVSRDPAPPQ
jgi:HEPN domain-containing protein